jgi:hypothetical protein
VAFQSATNPFLGGQPPKPGSRLKRFTCTATTQSEFILDELSSASFPFISYGLHEGNDSAAVPARVIARYSVLLNGSGAMMTKKKTATKKRSSKATTSLVPAKRIEQSIMLIRGHRVILDADLADLYGVPTRRLNEQVKRNSERFPDDFMFQMTGEELENWRSHFATSKPAEKMGLRRRPYCFTEYGALMAANVLKTPRAVQVITVASAMRPIITSANDEKQKGKVHVIKVEIPEVDEKAKKVSATCQRLFYCSTHKRVLPPVPSNNSLLHSQLATLFLCHA